MKAFDFIKLQSYALENQCRYFCRELSAEDFQWKPETGSPAIGWILGHIILSHDMTPNKQLLGNEPILSDDFRRDFGFKSSGNFPDSYNPEEMFSKFQIINQQIITSLSTKTEDWLSEIPEESDTFPPQLQNKSFLKLFVFHFSHVFAHTGQILEIRRMRGKDAWGF
ncbi:MAG: DinB family protein [Candidatus Thorarchaeota archaeon]